MLDLTHYTQEHSSELERLLACPQWQATITSGLIEEVKEERLEPGATRDYIDTVLTQLLGFNEASVRDSVARGCTDKTDLFRQLSRWPSGLEGQDPTLSFVGLNVTSACNSNPKCLYCNQPPLRSSVDLAGWKSIVEEVTTPDAGEGVYIYITGGEPLTLGTDIWGDNGLVRFATQRGAAVNINTNAALLTPEVALRLIKAGLAKLHISLDAVDQDVHNSLRPGHDFDQLLEGIYNVQLARDIVGVPYPVIHTNCVLTNRNVDLFPRLFSFVLEKHKQTGDSKDRLYNDLFPHVIPVGGNTNHRLRPSERQFRRFYEDIWPEVCGIWDGYQAGLGVVKEKRGVLFGYFSNPFLRVKHQGGLDAYVKASAEGRYGALALPQYCYVAPTQAAFTPDGYQYRCGSHAIRCTLPLGNIRERGVFENIRVGIEDLDGLPREEHCYGCALATLYINQAVEAKLKEKLDSMLAGDQRA